MSHQQKSANLRLEVEYEANALIAVWGMGARSVALQRAEEASNEQFMHDWSDVALAIGRRSARRPKLLSHLFH